MILARSRQVFKLERGYNFQQGLNAWTCATALPGILTLCVIAYGGLAWMANQPGQAKPLTLGSVKQGLVPAPMSSPASLPSLEFAAAPPAETEEAKHPTHSDKLSESVSVPVSITQRRMSQRLFRWRMSRHRLKWLQHPPLHET